MMLYDVIAYFFFQPAVLVMVSLNPYLGLVSRCVHDLYSDLVSVSVKLIAIVYICRA